VRPWPRPAIAVLPLLLAALAGCAGHAREGGAPAGAGAAEGASVRGVVVTPAIVPMGGVTVRLAPGAKVATTAEDGSFAFDGLQEGGYTIEAGKAGFRTVTLAVQAAPQGALVQVVLDPDPTVGRYFEAYVFDGFVSTSLNVAGARTTSATEANYTIGERTPDLIQSELVWEPTQDFGRWLDVTALPITGQTVVNSIGHAAGPSPLLLQLNSTAIAEGQLGPKIGLDLAVFAGEEPAAAGHGGGAMLDQPYRAVTHMFYGYLPPAGWRFTSDGDPPTP
jgi:hypothetical protein